MESLLLSVSSVGSIMDTLIKSYDRLDLIVRHLVTEGKNAPFVKSNFRSLIKIYRYYFIFYYDTLNMMTYLQYPQLLEELLRKLPYCMRFLWNKKKGQCFVAGFCNFVKRTL